MWGIQKWVLAWILGTALLGGTTVQASDCYRPCYYKTVVKYVPRQVAYKVRVVAYKPCGTPYYTWEVRYRTVQAPVSYQVKVCP